MIQRVQVTEVSSPDLGVDVESDPFSSLERGPKGNLPNTVIAPVIFTISRTSFFDFLALFQFSGSVCKTA
jgi:hypothetical protein